MVLWERESFRLYGLIRRTNMITIIIAVLAVAACLWLVWDNRQYDHKPHPSDALNHTIRMDKQIARDIKRYL